MKWIKENWIPLLVFIGVIIVANLLFVGGRKWSAKYDKLNAEYEHSVTEFEKFKIESQKEIAKIQKRRIEEEEKYKKIEAEIRQLEKDKEVISKERDAYKKKVVVAEPNFITTEIGKRIGTEEIQFTLAVVYQFQLSRTGANRTLFRFKDGETSQLNYKKQLEITEKKDKKIYSFINVVIPGYKEELKLERGNTSKAVKALNDCGIAKKQLEKDYRKQKWASLGKGFLGGIIFITLLRFVIGSAK